MIAGVLVKRRALYRLGHSGCTISGAATGGSFCRHFYSAELAHRRGLLQAILFSELWSSPSYGASLCKTQEIAPKTMQQTLSHSIFYVFAANMRAIILWSILFSGLHFTSNLQEDCGNIESITFLYCRGVYLGHGAYFRL